MTEFRDSIHSYILKPAGGHPLQFRVVPVLDIESSFDTLQWQPVACRLSVLIVCIQFPFGDSPPYSWSDSKMKIYRIGELYWMNGGISFLFGVRMFGLVWVSCVHGAQKMHLILYISFCFGIQLVVWSWCFSVIFCTKVSSDYSGFPRDADGILFALVDCDWGCVAAESGDFQWVSEGSRNIPIGLMSEDKIMSSLGDSGVPRQTKGLCF